MKFPSKKETEKFGSAESIDLKEDLL